MAAYSIPANPEYGLYTDRQVSWNTFLVMDWMLMVSDNTYLAGAFYFPCIWGVVDGVMLCVSNPVSTALSKVNSNTSMQIVQKGIPRPEFLPFNAYFHDGMNFGNIRGFSDGAYSGLFSWRQMFMSISKALDPRL